MAAVSSSNDDEKYSPTLTQNKLDFSSSSPVFPRVKNIIATVNLNCKLDLKYIVSHAKNAEYNPKRFSAVTMHIREPKSTALLYASGKMVCFGAKSEEQSRIAARKFVRIVQKLGFEAKFQDYKIQNIVGLCDVHFSIRLEALVVERNQFCSYEPELFPGIVYHMPKPKLILLIFGSGKIIFTGANYQSDLQEAFREIYPILKTFRK